MVIVPAMFGMYLGNQKRNLLAVAVDVMRALNMYPMVGPESRLRRGLSMNTEEGQSRSEKGQRMQAPFSREEIIKLLNWQMTMHPYTCAFRGDLPHRIIWGDKGTLIPTEEGWICVDCDFTQDWSHFVR